MSWIIRAFLVFATVGLPIIGATGVQEKSIKSDSVGGRRFIGISDFGAFTKTDGTNGENIITSAEIDPQLNWDELVVSWNADTPAGADLTVNATVIYSDHKTKPYLMGRWSPDPAAHPRESVKNQQDEDGDVQTDTLVVTHPGGKVQLTVTLGGGARPRFLGLSFLDTKAPAADISSERQGWGKTLDVPERCQLSYKGGERWCSPTSTSMALAYWARQMKRRELDRDVPMVAAEVFDKNWPGTGNWPFNTAFAGSFPGMRAYVTRLSSVSELEEWIAAGVPVVLSLSYRLLHEKGKSDGHIVVLAGFTPSGQPIINDPWEHLEKGDRVRQVCKRENLERAWAVSKNTVYLIYPESWPVPPNRYSHWAGPTRAAGR